MNSVLEVINLDDTKSSIPTSTIQIGNQSESAMGRSNTPRSVNFGPGIEMLMNEKKRSGSDTPKSDININDLEKLESELNELSEPSAPSVSKLNATNAVFSTPFSTMHNSLKPQQNDVKLNLNKSDTIQIGKSTTQTDNGKKTWDGFQKFNEIPVDPTKNVTSAQQHMSNAELLKKKFEILRKLEMLESKGVKVSKKYSMESSLAEMQGEYEMIVSEKEKHASVKFQGKMLMACVTGLEYLNGKFDPFDLRMDGWAESVNENVDDYDEIFEELHEKYKSKAKMAPELKLLFQLAGSGIMVHMTNTMFKSSMPGMEDIMRQNPELMQQFTKAAVSSMGNQNPGFGNFMGGLMGAGGNGNSGPSGPNIRQSMPPMGSPPGPQSQPQYEQRRSERAEIIPPGPQSGPQSRPDIGMSRGQPSFSDAANMETSYASATASQRVKTTSHKPPTERPDMQGPRDISELLAGLKTKKINIRQPEMMSNRKGGVGGSSTISIDELKLISKDADNMPKRSKRRPKSERNTVSISL